MDTNYNPQVMFGRRTLSIENQENKPVQIKFKPSAVDENITKDEGVVGYMGDEDLNQSEYNIVSNFTDKLDIIDNRIEVIYGQIDSIVNNKNKIIDDLVDQNNTTLLGIQERLTADESVINFMNNEINNFNSCNKISESSPCNSQKDNHCSWYEGDGSEPSSGACKIKCEKFSKLNCQDYCKWDGENCLNLSDFDSQCSSPPCCELYKNDACIKISGCEYDDESSKCNPIGPIDLIESIDSIDSILPIIEGFMDFNKRPSTCKLLICFILKVIAAIILIYAADKGISYLVDQVLIILS